MAHKSTKLIESRLEAWKEAMQADLDRQNKLFEEIRMGKSTPEKVAEWQRLNSVLKKASNFVEKEFNALVSFSGGSEVHIEPRRLKLEGAELI